MTTIAIPNYLLVCDGCSVQFDESHRSGMELRAAAYGAGWRFPPLLKLNGQPSTGATASTSSDVCPACFPTWKPRKRGESTAVKYQPLDERDGEG